MVSMTARRERLASDVQHDGDGTLTYERNGRRVGARAVARDGPYQGSPLRWIAWEAVLLTHCDGTEDSARSSLNFPTNASYDEVRMILLNWAR
jgi:hypothetical protein